MISQWYIGGHALHGCRGRVSGLSTAIRLLESGHEVEIVSDQFSPQTVSDVAAAIYILSS